MKKNIIISGTAASGKSHIAQAIAFTHKKTLHTNAKDFIDKLLESAIKPKIIKGYSLIIVDECSIEHITNIDRVTSNNEAPVHNGCPIVYLTQQHIHGQHHLATQMHVINCNNKTTEYFF